MKTLKAFYLFATIALTSTAFTSCGDDDKDASNEEISLNGKTVVKIVTNREDLVSGYATISQKNSLKIIENGFNGVLITSNVASFPDTEDHIPSDIKGSQTTEINVSCIYATTKMYPESVVFEEPVPIVFSNKNVEGLDIRFQDDDSNTIESTKTENETTIEVTDFSKQITHVLYCGIKDTDSETYTITAKPTNVNGKLMLAGKYGVETDCENELMLTFIKTSFGTNKIFDSVEVDNADATYSQVVSTITIKSGEKEYQIKVYNKPFVKN